MPLSIVRSSGNATRRWLTVWVLLAAFALADSLVAPSSAEARSAEGPDRATANGEAKEAELRLAQRRRRRRRPRRPPRRSRRAPAEEESSADEPADSPSTPAATPDTGELRRGARVEFDGRLVQGQTAKSGAIYLFARKRSELRSMVKERENYRKEILRTVFPRYTTER